jgi:penicillin-binding protein 1A
MSRRQRQKRRKQHNGGVRRGLLVAVSVAIVGVFIGVLALIGYIVGIAASAPSIDSLKPIDHGSTSSIYADNGQRLGFITSDELRTPVDTAQLQHQLQRATVAIEDSRFYKHKGVDYEGIVRAGIKNLESGHTVQGGSTITMQLVRNLYTGDRDRNFQRKIREAKLAEELEKEHNKTWILTNYLNNVSYGTVGGSTAVGAAAAARIFFDKPVNRLDLREAALLAGLPQAPSIYNPFRDPRGALARRNEVLRRMATLGMISPHLEQFTARQGLGVRQNQYYSARKESYFFDYVKSELIQRYGLNTVRKGGLKVYTTIDLKLQEEARKAIEGVLPYSSDPSSAIVTIDPSTGYIKAMASSGSYGKNQYNLAAQGHRQPGSAFKPMVLMTALRKGVDPNTTTYNSHPLKLDLPKYGHWEVNTYSHSYGGTMNLVEATLQSDNTVYAQLDLDLGPEAVRQTAYDMGIQTKLEGLPAEGLGGMKIGVSPLEMANAYATMADGGYRNTPIAVKRVIFPDGKSEDIGHAKRVKAFPDGITSAATQILAKNAQSGTATAAPYGCPMAAKTGTTDDFTDAWLVGFTPKLSTAVWVGYPDAKVPMTDVHGIQVNGGSLPAQIWHDYMSTAHGSDCSDFPPPTERAQFTPFLGKYSGAGSSSDSKYGGNDYGGYYSGGQKRRGGGGGPANGYNPQFYEAPPQPAPQVQVPATPAPAAPSLPRPNPPTGATGQHGQ